MSFPRYPRYKASGVEWLGDVPEHWKVQTLARVTIDKCDGPFGSAMKSEHYTDEGVRVVRLQNIKDLCFDDADAAFVSEAYYRSELIGHEVEAADVIIAGLGDENNRVGRACVAPSGVEPAMVKADCFRFRLDTRLARPAFVAAQLSSGAAYDAGMLATGSTRARIPLSEMAGRILAVPPLDEQNFIETFLRVELTKIDGLIAEQERLIGLLKEKRQAVISHAVTKGLDPSAPMKPSGVEWLGDVPAHWEVNRLSRLMNFSSGKAHEPYLDEDGPHIYISARFVSTQGESVKFCRENLTPAFCGDIVMVMSDLPNGRALARAFLISDDCSYAVNQRVCRLSDFEGSHRFYFYQLDRNLGLLRNDDGFNQTHLSNSDYQKLELSVPPLKEQLQIAAFLDAQTGKFDDLQKSAKSGIALLQERRAALISAAVTGKIDVRGLVNADAEAA